MVLAVTPPKSTSALKLPERLEPLARQLAELEPNDRELLIRAVQTHAPNRKRRGVSWEQLEKLKGIVSLGGNAVEDCRAVSGASVNWGHGSISES
jgi:hypothetical protein